jgi:hypothetical protein
MYAIKASCAMAQNVTTYSRFAQGGDISGRVMLV